MTEFQEQIAVLQEHISALQEQTMKLQKQVAELSNTDKHLFPNSKLARDRILTYVNLVSQAVLYQKKYLPKEENLKTVVQHMIKHTNWRPSIQMVKKGVPDFYQIHFEVQIGIRSDYDMKW